MWQEPTVSHMIQWLSINRWNGQLPYALGTGASPFFQLPRAKMQDPK
jgi:prohibitin 2